MFMMWRSEEYKVSSSTMVVPIIPLRQSLSQSLEFALLFRVDQLSTQQSCLCIP